MKKVIIVMLLVLLSWFFYNLWQNNKSFEDAKKDMWVLDDKSESSIDNKKDLELNDTLSIEKEQDIYSPTYVLEYLDDNNFIELDNLDSKVESLKEEIEITWKVLNLEVDKIIVSFKNTSSDFPNDKYELEKFKKGDAIFEYNANSKVFRNLDYWNNEYTLEAYVWDVVSIVKLNINIPEELWDEEVIWESINKEIDTDSLESEKVTYEKKIIWSTSDPVYLWMPISDSFWKPLSLWEGWITYSNISWLNIVKSDFSSSDLASDVIWKSDWTWYLNKNIESPFVYWNTYREIDYNKKDAWVSFYVLRKSEEKYIYEKHYFDFNHSLKGVLKIEEFDIGVWSVSVEMSELNGRLKKQNDDFDLVKVTDKLFKEIVR